jgi:DNA-binding MarR family transcriptional regulator
MHLDKKNESYDIGTSYPMLLSTCTKLLRESLNRRFADAGLSITSEQWIFLVNLWYQEGVSQQALADKYERSKVAAFRLIEKLETQGYLCREADPNDGRSKRVYLTEQGRQLVPKLFPLANENKKQAARGISQKDLEIFKQVAKQISTNISTAKN